MWLTSNRPARVRTARCSSTMPEYSTGMSQPPNSTIRPPLERCLALRGVFLSDAWEVDMCGCLRLPQCASAADESPYSVLSPYHTVKVSSPPGGRPAATTADRPPVSTHSARPGQRNQGKADHQDHGHQPQADTCIRLRGWRRHQHERHDERRREDTKKDLNDQNHDDAHEPSC